MSETMKAATKKLRVGPEHADRLREIATLLDQLRHAGAAKDLRAIADQIAPEPSALRQKSLTYVYRLLLVMLRPRANGKRIKVEVGRLYGVRPTSVPVIAANNKAYADRQLARLYGGDTTISPKRIEEELLSIIPLGKRLGLKKLRLTAIQKA
jgi:hypothetical protein